MKSKSWLRYPAVWGVAFLVFFLSPVAKSLAQPSGYPCWGPGSWMMGGTWGWIGGIMMFLFWGLILIALVLFIRWLVAAGGSSGRSSPGSPESPLDILKKRYARGEISKEQYESMRRDLD